MTTSLLIDKAARLPSVRRTLLSLAFACIAPMLVLFIAASTWQGSRALLYAAALAAIAGTLMAAVAIAGRLADSMELLCAAVRAAGDADIWLPPARSLEEQRLGQAFRYTAARLQDTHEALERKEAFLRTVVDSACDAIVTSDEEGRIVLFNRAASDMFGIPAADALGMPLERLLPAAARGSHLASMRAMDPNQERPRRMGRTHPVVALHAVGRPFPVTAAISCGTDGTRRYYTAILRHARRDMAARNEDPAAARSAA